MIGLLRAASTTPLLFHFPFHLSFIRSGLVWARLVGGFGWLETPTDFLSVVGTTFPFQWASRSSTAVDVWWASAPNPESHGISCHDQSDSTSQWSAWLGSRLQTFCCSEHRSLWLFL
uniref:Uncharacterized protein n=1 Tax=Fagus sylvatica TaxID=28930 RepID=A0A2N9EX29_FAGSY